MWCLHLSFLVLVPANVMTHITITDCIMRLLVPSFLTSLQVDLNFGSLLDSVGTRGLWP